MLTLEAQTIARACGKSHLHNLEPEDLVALTVESAAMAQVPLAGTDWIPGKANGMPSSGHHVLGETGAEDGIGIKGMRVDGCRLGLTRRRTASSIS